MKIKRKIKIKVKRKNVITMSSSPLSPSQSPIEYNLTARETLVMERFLQAEREAQKETRAALSMLLQAHDLEDGEWQYNGGVLRKVQAQTQRPQLEEMSAPAPMPALEIARAPVQQASRLVLDALAARESNDAEKAVERSEERRVGKE